MTEDYAQQPLVPAFRHAMNALDVATRPSVSEELHPNELREVFSEASRLGLEVVQQFERMMSDLYEVRHQITLAQREARIADLRLSVCRAERDSLEATYIETKIDMQDIARQAAEMNERKNEAQRFARSLEKTVAEQARLLEESNAKLQDAIRDLTEERNVAIDANIAAGQRIELLVTEKTNAVKIARRRRLVLLDVKKHFAGDGMLVEADLLDKIRDACRTINYTTGELTPPEQEETREETQVLHDLGEMANSLKPGNGLIPISDPRHPYHQRAEHTPVVGTGDSVRVSGRMKDGEFVVESVTPTEQEIAEATTMPRRLHEWESAESAVTEEGVDIICKFCGVKQWEAQMEGGDAGLYCLDTGINDLAAYIAVGDVMEAKADPFAKYDADNADNYAGQPS